MALGGVLIGNIKSQLAAMVTGMANTSGDAPEPAASAVGGTDRGDDARDCAQAWWLCSHVKIPSMFRVILSRSPVGSTTPLH